MNANLTTAGLWIEDSGMTDDEIRAACAPAAASLSAAGVTIDLAYAASLAECDGQDFDPAALAAWKTAERIALGGVAADAAILTIA